MGLPLRQDRRMVNRMDDLISRQAAIEAASKGCFELRGVFGQVKAEINALPSADVQPVTPMHWIPVDPFNGGWTSRWECSACGSKVTLGYCTDVMLYDFCPYCGAKDGE